MMHKISNCFALRCRAFNRIVYIVIGSWFLMAGQAKANLPRPDHVVICILENHGYPQVVGSGAAPYINQLATMGANLQEFYALTHPSQPNYLMLFGGSNFGVTTDNVPTGTPWTSPNLGSLLQNAGFTFAGYSEDLPAIGSNSASSGGYARKHNPWVNWQGSGQNQLPDYCNLPMTQFPTDFNLLPTVSFVVPNQDNDMHNGSDPGRITQADTWVQNHLQSYVTWAQSHNSLFILTFDEDNGAYQNHIPCIMTGPMVQPGNYWSIGYNLYDLLRTLEDMYGLPYAGNSANGHSILEIWNSNPTGISAQALKPVKISINPNPANNNSIVKIEGDLQNFENLRFVLYDLLGNKVNEELITANADGANFLFRKSGLRSGLYFFRLLGNYQVLSAGKVVVE